ncbi:MAG: DUF2520 domain-containing protein [Acidobacteriaceae bacterium]|nr:DUF2520 domain-containing protein [Acidobacteriaceae bacterium]
MKKQLPVGLVVEGNSTNSTVLRLPNLPQEIGPIKSSALRIARRFSNLLRAGYAVSSYEELQSARLVLIHVPDAAVPRVAEELCSSELDLSSVSCVFCETWLMADSLSRLTECGASVATLLTVPSSWDKWFVLEGQAPAIRHVRRLLDKNNVRVLELKPQSKPLYFAAELLATTLPIPLLTAAQHALRDAGISGNHLHTLLEEMSQKMFKDFAKGSRVPWGGPLNACSGAIADDYFAALRKTHPRLATFVDQQLSLAAGL